MVRAAALVAPVTAVYMMESPAALVSPVEAAFPPVTEVTLSLLAATLLRKIAWSHFMVIFSPTPKLVPVVALMVMTLSAAVIEPLQLEI